LVSPLTSMTFMVQRRSVMSTICPGASSRGLAEQFRLDQHHEFLPAFDRVDHRRGELGRSWR
jgi:hypothetical protein